MEEKNSPKREQLIKSHSKGSLTPHDDFFRLLMDNKENAAALIRADLPQKLAEKLDLNSLKPINTSFTDGKLGNFKADVIYEGLFGGEQKVLVTLLFEHKSYVEPYPHLQLLQYMLGIWLQQRNNREALRPIIPIIFYHGQEKWEYRPFSDYFEGGDVDPELLPFLPRFDYWLLSLRTKAEDWIRTNIPDQALQIALLLMKSIGDPNILSRLPVILKGCEQLLKSPEGKRKFEEIYLYLFRGGKPPKGKIVEAMDHITYMNLPHPVGSPAWQIEQEAIQKGMEKGKKEGKREGMKEGKREIALNMLKENFSKKMIAKITGLALKEVQKLAKHT